LAFDAENHWYASCFRCAEPGQHLLFRFGTDNEIEWTQPISVLMGAMIVSAKHGIVGTGGFVGDVELAGQKLKNHGTAAWDGPAGLNAFVAQLEPDGTPRWAIGFGEARDDVGMAVALDGKGNSLVSGVRDFSSNSFGGGAVPGRAFVAAFASAGAEFWRGVLNGVTFSSAAGVAVDADSSVFVAGYVDSDVDGSWLTADRDVFVAKFAVPVPCLLEQ